MALDMVQVMAELGFGAFAVAGHDRGGRVGYRMALDHPAVVTRLAVLDIVPTHVMWQRMDRELAMATYHWLFWPSPTASRDPDRGRPGLVGAGEAAPLGRRPTGVRPRRWRSTCAASPTRRPSRLLRGTTGPGRASTTGSTPPIWAGGASPAGAGPVGRRRDRPPGRGPARLLASLVRRPPRPRRAGGHFEESPAETLAALLDFLRD